MRLERDWRRTWRKFVTNSRLEDRSLIAVVVQERKKDLVLRGEGNESREDATIPYIPKHGRRRTVKLR